MKFINLIRKIQKGGYYLLMTVVGIGFLLSFILPVILPDVFVSDSSLPMGLVFAAIGIVSIFFGIKGMGNATWEIQEKTNYFDMVNEEAAGPELIREIRENPQPLKDYYFHFCGKLNQSYVLETTDREPVYEFDCDKMGMLNDYIFTFRNCLTHEETSHNVSHTVTVSYGSDDFSLVDRSYFKIDGKNIWEYIAEMGYAVEPYLDKLAWSFRIRHYSVQVADLKAAGTNILKEYEGKKGLRDVPMMEGLYRVSCRQDDIEAVAIIAFAVSRVQIV
ncbi:MAG: hypothetical protein IJM15_02595 [Erysipelotrichaceae bacterium]|nr:hypothetical protein [Erysipelotrichaceae bacterium]